MARITVEDCLVQENNRFALVQLASKRTKQLLQGSAVQTAEKKNKAVVTALREIADGKVRFMTPLELAEFQEQQRIEAEAAAAAAEAERQRRSEVSAAGIFGGINNETRSPSFLRDSLMATGPASAGDDDDDDEE